MRSVWALAIMLCLLAVNAHAVEQIVPFPYSSVNKASGTITTGGTSQQALAANPNRKGFCIYNPSSNTESLFYDLGVAATITDPKSIEVTAGNGQCIGGLGVWTGTVTLNATTTGHGFIVYEFR